MKTIHKHQITEQEITYDREGFPRVSIPAPSGAKVIHVQCQYAHHKLPTVWYEVDDRSTQGSLELWVIPTGGQVPSRGHIGSAVCSGGAYVWHIYG